MVVRESVDIDPFLPYLVEVYSLDLLIISSRLELEAPQCPT